MADSVDNYWTLLSSLVWPGSILAVGIIFKDQLSRLIGASALWVKGITEVKVGSIELKGVLIDPGGDIFDKTGETSRVPATKLEKENRNKIYNSSRNILLVHKIRPSTKKGQLFDISIYLIRKMNKGHPAARFNEIDYVEYYLGSYFGAGEFGSKYIIKNPDNGFAMQTSAYGGTVCVATVHFHDGEVSTLNRYIDFEMGNTADIGNQLVFPDATPKKSNED